MIIFDTVYVCVLSFFSVCSIHLPTVVNIRNLLLEIDDRGYIVDSEFFRRLLVVDLHELNTMLVAIVVDLL